MCKVYCKSPPTPIAANHFQETVAMDLKFYNKKICSLLLTTVQDCLLPLSSPKKNPDTLIKATFKLWISVYGSAETFLYNNGGECANGDFTELCESFGIILEAPWSKGLVELHNLILSDMLDKSLYNNNRF